MKNKIKFLRPLMQNKKTNIDDNVILVRIAQNFKEGMTDEEILNTARHSWVVGERREKADYVLAVANGTVVGVFSIYSWYRAEDAPSRHGFEGGRAPDSIYRKYINKDVSDYFQQGNSNPILYVNC